jgi:hypothetical protein
VRSCRRQHAAKCNARATIECSTGHCPWHVPGQEPHSRFGNSSSGYIIHSGATSAMQLNLLLLLPATSQPTH